jgi:hypothetical protein
MDGAMVIQGRSITPADVQLMHRLMASNPSWGRSRLSVELCQRWQWRRTDGQPKDMACRTLLLKLERAGHVRLPPRQAKPPNALRNRSIPHVPHETEEIDGGLDTLLPLQIVSVPARSGGHALFKCLVSRHHYLGLKNTVGQNMKYLVRDCRGRPLACMLFGSAAWKTGPRDAFIGWDRRARESNLQRLTNNTRFLILPWVKVPHLASHVLSRVTRRVSHDWVEKYGQAVDLLETFVDRQRFRGTCYRAANWILVGQTTGRTRNDRDSSIHAPVKDIYVYPLSKYFREELSRVDA